MDEYNEKDAERAAGGSGGRRVRIEDPQDRPESTVSEVIDHIVQDLEKPREPSPTDGTDREKHRSADMEADRYKRESVETNHRFSQITANTETDGGFSDVEKAKEEEAGLQRPQTAVRPPHNRAGASVATTVGAGSRRSMPSLRRKETKLAQKEAHPWQHLGITLGLPMVLLFDLVVPCIIYYTWYDSHKAGWERRCREEYPNQPCPTPRPQYDSDILGYAIICFGFGELWILISRVHRLFFHQDECAPLLSRSRWELDATSWVYGVAILLALIPFVIGSEGEYQHLYLYSPSFIMAFLGLLMLITTAFPFTLPIGINSQPRGTKLRPFIYYAAEDFIAVDGLQDREFRVRYNERYETNRRFRRLFTILTVWWISGVAVYIGCVSAVIWTCEFHTAFGLSLGVLFAYIVFWAAGTFLFVDWEMKREHAEYEAGEVEA